MTPLEALAQRIRACQDCPLARTRTQAVPGEGPDTPLIMCIGEAPGYHEDQEGRPFVGPAGRFLEELLASVGIKRSEVYITNVVKCRPPDNRDPLPGEIEACKKYLDEQIALLRPKIIVTLGRYSLARFAPKESISKVHGKPRRIPEGILFPMYHPAAALHYQGLRPVLEQDIRLLPELIRQVQQGLAQVPSAEPPPQQLSLF
ncbi:MAG: uracil-DNA glycosylase [Dehalococcoidia bacterium]|nr:uracil-DNA glycosylase [Dehalococcoidia bacterium]MDW8120078.1 uracil-DNA glycosylase [Chloroflexota bacterium]